MQTKEGSSAPTFTEVTQSVGQHEEREEKYVSLGWSRDGWRSRRGSREADFRTRTVRADRRVKHCVLAECWLADEQQSSKSRCDRVSDSSGLRLIYNHHLDRSSIRHEAEFIWRSSAGWMVLIFHSVFSETRNLLAAGQKITGVIETDTLFVFYATLQWNLEGNDPVCSSCCVQTWWQTAAGSFSIICFLLLTGTVWRVQSNRWPLFSSDEFIHSFITNQKLKHNKKQMKQQIYI